MCVRYELTKVFGSIKGKVILLVRRSWAGERRKQQRYHYFYPARLLLLNIFLVIFGIFVCTEERERRRRVLTLDRITDSLSLSLSVLLLLLPFLLQLEQISLFCWYYFSWCSLSSVPNLWQGTTLDYWFHRKGKVAEAAIPLSVLHKKKSTKKWTCGPLSSETSSNSNAFSLWTPACMCLFFYAGHMYIFLYVYAAADDQKNIYAFCDAPCKRLSHFWTLEKIYTSLVFKSLFFSSNSAAESIIWINSHK